MTYEELVIRFSSEIVALDTEMEMSDILYSRFYEYFLNSGEMPYSVAKGDSHDWVYLKLFLR